MNKLLVYLFLLSFFVAINQVYSQEVGSSTPAKEKVDLFTEQKVLPVKLQYSQKVLRQNTKDSIFTISELSYMSEDEEWGKVNVKLKARGNFRKANCFFPPVMIKIKKSDAKGSIFKGHKKLKLVLPCLKGKGGNDDILKELIAYKIFEVLSPYHFKTRRLLIDFDDPNDKRKDHYELVGFLIEDDKAIARREDVKLIKRSIPPLAQDPISSIRVDLFQFMIGNVDYSAVYQHNCKLIYQEGTIIPIPYDFDMCGFVDPVYGVLPAQNGTSFSISNIRERLYRGYRRDEEDFQTVRQEFLSHKDEIIQILESYEEEFTNHNKYKKAEKYITSFFRIIENDQRFRNDIILKSR